MERNNWLLWAGGGLMVLCLGVVCVLGAYMAAGRILSPAPTSPPLVIPTLLGGDLTQTAQAVQSSTPGLTPTPPLLIGPTVTLSSNVSSSQVEAGQLPAAPTIDGNLGEWATIPTVSSAFRVYNSTGWDGSQDLTALWRLAWDTTNLYLAAEVTDNVHVQIESGNQIFRGDSLEIQIDTNRPAGASQVNPATFQFILSPGNFADLPPSAFRFQGNSQGQIPDAPGHHLLLAAQQTSTGYILEVAIPWNDINVSPVSGRVYGLALNANDNDTPGTAIQEVMMSNVSTRTLRDPRTWGTLTLR